MFFHGQKVICIEDTFNRNYLAPGHIYDCNLNGLKKGEIYTIRKIGPNPGDGMPCIWLDEIIRPNHEIYGEVGYNINRFRPIVEKKKTTDISVFLKILDNVKGKVDV